MRYIFIINSLANAKYLKALDDAIASVNSDLRLRIEIRYTEYTGHAKDIAAEVSDRFGDSVAIVACGGDGTVHEIVNALVYRNTPMIVLPMGTGNDFVRSVFPFKECNDLKYMLSKLDKIAFYPIDLVRMDSYDILGTHLSNWSSYADNIASIGLDTVVQAEAKAVVRAKNNWFNIKTAYLRAAVRAIVHRSSFKFDYCLELSNGEVFESKNQEHTLIAICNGQYYGNGFHPAPNALLDDGIIDVCVVDKVNFFRAAYLLTLYKFGRHIGKSGIHTYQCTSGTITCHDKTHQLLGNYDGEDFFGQRIRFEVFPAALKVGFLENNLLQAKEKGEMRSKYNTGDHLDLNQINPHGVLSIDESVTLMSRLTKSLQVDWEQNTEEESLNLNEAVATSVNTEVSPEESDLSVTKTVSKDSEPL